MANCIIEEQNLYDIADAIRTRNGEVTLYKPSEMAGKILDIDTSDLVNPNNPVRLLDFDGTIIRSYTKESFNSLTEYPNPPSHEDIIFDEYNWSLQEAKTFLQTHDELDIGAIYKTENNATIIYLEGAYNVNLPLCYAINGNSTVTTSLGSTFNMNGTSESTMLNHTIATTEDELMKITITTANDAKIVLSGGSNGGYLVTGSNPQKLIYLNRVKRIVFGNVKLGSNALRYMNGCSEFIFTNGCEIDMTKSNLFSYNKGVKHVNIPKSMTGVQTNMFSESSVESVSLPSTVTKVESYAFAGSTIKKLIIPENVTVINTYAFENAYSLKQLDLPSTITSLNAEMFSSCYAIQKIKIPTLTTVTTNFTNLFMNCNTLQEVTIPNQITSFPQRMFYNCYSLTYLKVPSTLTSIDTVVFDNSGLQVIDFSDVSVVPSLGSVPSSLINNSTYQVVVPDSLYSTWITTTNWSNISSHIISESDYNN